jgi:DnaJ-class molecular chaperone
MLTKSMNLVCTKCKGNGQFHSKENPCSTCRGQRVLASPGKGNVICPKCEGNGVRVVKVQCDCCQGRGSHMTGPCKYQR